jgi:hypothetical protein
MRCIACGVELRLGLSGLGNTTLVPSDEHCSFLCSDCDRPLLVGPDSALPPAEPEPISSAPADATLVPTTPPTLVPSEGGNDLDDCEVLLKRAIEMVRGPTRGSLPAKGLTDGGAGTHELDGSLPVHSAPPTSTPALIEADSDLDECEVLLKRAIEMVRGPTRRMPRSSLMNRAVQIHHDRDDATYIATDIKSGLSVLRHQDRARLLGMCNRIGWQVIEDAGLKAPDARVGSNNEAVPSRAACSLAIASPAPTAHDEPIAPPEAPRTPARVWLREGSEGREEAGEGLWGQGLVSL